MSSPSRIVRRPWAWAWEVRPGALDVDGIASGEAAASGEVGSGELDPGEAPYGGIPSADELRSNLRRAWDLLDVGPPDATLTGREMLAGQLLRPRFAVSAAGGVMSAPSGQAFWLATLAIQLAHEASLLHDDVVDEARVRRGKPTLVSRGGAGAALIAGDQLLARAYLAAACTGNAAFIHRFARAVDQTIEGERAQGRSTGKILDDATTREIARRKSGELFGCALAIPATLRGADEADHLVELGRDAGMLYQRIDDLLDFCPRAETGKPPLADHARGLWTWPRAYLAPDAPPETLFQPADARSRQANRATATGGRHGDPSMLNPNIPALAALNALESEGAALLDRLERDLPHAEAIRHVVRGWMSTAREAVSREVSADPIGTEQPDAGSKGTGGTLEESIDAGGLDPARLLSRHGTTFYFASRLLADEVRGPITRIYAFCRRVDDAVDRASDAAEGEGRLNALHLEAWRAYHHGPRRIHPTVIERTMTEMRSAGAPFAHVEELVSGVRMDLWPGTFADMNELRVYTHRVAGVVGLWIAGLAGVRDPWALRLAGELGHAMQLTNIARDVGADLEMGRLYLPLDLMDRHDLTPDDLVRIAGSDEPVPSAFAALLEELMGMADAGYGAAFQALPRLPSGYRRAMAVAARVYQGIHGEIRGNGYDSLRRRARTGPFGKGRLFLSALRELSSAEGRAKA